MSDSLCNQFLIDFIEINVIGGLDGEEQELFID